ncbi:MULTISPECIES: autotransporter outer membrane beta-barrel domain-containing protein [unclassified Campylobacter]|uniref:autotransporter outer membrane beta-barrel domain-containing protein n=1 Tax=unclassified Campylobacter TaxID=2593542 RepID=UPI001BD9D8F4|nr:autotransporter outer membrane beta-barrel domain-containing protein [Campylobacter sp. 2018MI27]MBT0884376.1 autotransporter outer membrane beta-barrel domain-containing protein [Campylobacter sp. 2018MI10]
MESFGFKTFPDIHKPFNDNFGPFDNKKPDYYKTNLKNITDITEESADNVNVYFSEGLSNKNFPISFDNSFWDSRSKTISNSNNITIKNSLIKSYPETAKFNNGNNFIAENSFVNSSIKNFNEVKAINSYLDNIENGQGIKIDLTNSAVNSIYKTTGTIDANGGRINGISYSNVNLNGTKDNLVKVDNFYETTGSINHADVTNIEFGKDLTITNSNIGLINVSKNLTIKDSTIKEIKSTGILGITNSNITTSINSYDKVTLTDSIVGGKVNGINSIGEYKGSLDSKGSTFNDDIYVTKLTLNTSESGKQSKVKAIKTIRAGAYDIDRLDTGDKYYIGGSIIGEGTIKNSTINMQLSGSKGYTTSALINQDNFYNEFADEKNENSLTIANTSSINLDNVIATNSVRAHTLDIKNSKVAKRVLANSLTSNNTAYYLGTNKESYTGAIISRENTSGANNELVLLNVMSDNKLDTSKINANLPLAILKKGTGTAELATFFKDYKISDGISDYVINNDYVASAMLGDYLTYAITTNKNGKVSDTGLNADNIVSIANGDKTSALGKLVNQSSSDMDSEVLDLYLNNLANSNYVSNTTDETPNQPDTNNPDTGVTNPENPSNPDTGVTNPDNKPDNKPDTGVTNPIDKNQIADDFIKDIKINKNAKAQAQVISKGINLINTFAWNNMNKRLGEIRGLDKELGVWARAYYTNASIDDVKLNSFEVQFGADKANDFADGNVITGIMANISNSKSSDVLKGNNYGFGLYTSYISNNDLYADLVIKANHYKVKYNSELLKGLKDSKTGFIASFELGKRFDLNRFYVEPSIEAIFDYTPKTNLENNAISITSKANSNLHIKPAVFSGFKVNDNANIRLGAGYIIDVNKPSDSIIIAKSSKASETIKGKRDNKFYLNLTGDYKFNDNLRLNLGYERTFGADFNIDNQINAVVRYTF